jgi:hypothetical protein
MEVRLRMGEAFTLMEEPEAALACLEEVRGDVSSASLWGPLSGRIYGYALAQEGDLPAARSAFEESLALARSRNAEFDVLEAITALIRLNVAEGVPVPTALAAEGKEILERLQIAAVTYVPLPAR